MARELAENSIETSTDLTETRDAPEKDRDVPIPGDPGKAEEVPIPGDPGRDHEVSIPGDPGGDADECADAPRDGADPGASTPENSGGDVKETEDTALKALEEILKDPEKLKELLEKYPEKQAKIQEAIDKLNDEKAAPLEKRNAGIYLKGTLLEMAAKEVLSAAGLTVEEKQRTVEGENGKTRPDVIAKNETDKTIRVFGRDVAPGETISVECKCGAKSYLSNELNGHIPDQLSGHEGHSVLLTTSDIKGVEEKAEQVCAKTDTTLCVADVSAAQVVDTVKDAGAAQAADTSNKEAER